MNEGQQASRFGLGALSAAEFLRGLELSGGCSMPFAESSAEVCWVLESGSLGCFPNGDPGGLQHAQGTLEPGLHPPRGLSEALLREQLMQVARGHPQLMTDGRQRPFRIVQMDEHAVLGAPQILLMSEGGL